MTYVHSLPASASFTGKGLLGYTFGPLSQKDLEIYYVEVEKGHDVFMISRKIARTYYILSGGGYFSISGRRYDVGPGMLVEIPPKVEYCYSGRMTLITISKPRWFSGNDTFTRWNPDVFGRDIETAFLRSSWLTRLARFSCFGKSPVNVYLRIHQRFWDRIPSFLINRGPIRAYGDFLHTVARMQNVRAQAFATLFLRNRPKLELIRQLLGRKSKGEALNVAVLGCSTGPEAYSVAWTIRSARPDLKLTLHAMDISRQAVEFAACGVYSIMTSHLTGTNIFEGLTAAEMEDLFERDGDALTVKSWVREGIKWHVGDAEDPEMIDALGLQDFVIANNFLCHMSPPEAEKCLRNIAQLVKPGGYLFVAGVDLDVRTKVARDLAWEPLPELLEEIHDGDPYLRKYWPCHYGGLEPLNKGRRDWRLRYASCFRLDQAAVSSQAPRVIEAVTERK